MKKLLTRSVLLVSVAFTMISCVSLTSNSTRTETYTLDGVRVVETTNVNNSDTASYFEAAVSHKASDDNKLATMAKAVMESEMCVDCTGEGRAWSDAFKVMIIGYGSNFQAEQFKLQKPKSGMDVVDTAIGGLVDLGKTSAYVYGGVELGKSLLSSKGSQEVYFGDDNTVEGSFIDAPTEVHATQIGDGGPDAIIGDPIYDNSVTPVE